MTAAERKVRFYVKLEGVASLLIRLLVIVFSCVVAAQKNLKDSPLDFLASWVPVLALTVAILTGLDTWRKPREKWKAHQRFLTKIWDLKSDMALCSHDDLKELERIGKEFQKAEKVHQAETI
jgi:hypothetical protein